MNKKIINVPKRIKVLILLMPSLIIGFATTMISTSANSGYTVVKRMTGNNADVAYHLANNSKKLFEI